MKLITGKKLSENEGFIALFFVLAISMTLSSIVYGLSHVNSFRISLFDGYRERDTARSAAYICKKYLHTRLMYELDFVPELYKVSEVSPDKYCEYINFTMSLTADIRKYSFSIVGISKKGFKHYLSGDFYMSSDLNVFYGF